MGGRLSNARPAVRVVGPVSYMIKPRPSGLAPLVSTGR